MEFQKHAQNKNLYRKETETSGNMGLNLQAVNASSVSAAFTWASRVLSGMVVHSNLPYSARRSLADSAPGWSLKTGDMARILVNCDGALSST
jgi:hypothetical protein